MSSILKAYLKNADAIKRYLRRFGFNPADAEDIAQEAFVRAFAAEPEHPICFPKAFLFRTARNLALNEREKFLHSKTDSLEDFADPSVIVDEQSVSADDRIDARERVRLLAQAVASLPPQCSRAFLLRKIQGLSYKDIAERMNISVSTAEKHVALGLLKCSDYLRSKGYSVGRADEAREKKVCSSKLCGQVDRKSRRPA